MGLLDLTPEAINAVAAKARDRDATARVLGWPALWALEIVAEDAARDAALQFAERGEQYGDEWLPANPDADEIAQATAEKVVQAVLATLALAEQSTQAAATASVVASPRPSFY